MVAATLGDDHVRHAEHRRIAAQLQVLHRQLIAQVAHLVERRVKVLLALFAHQGLPEHGSHELQPIDDLWPPVTPAHRTEAEDRAQRAIDQKRYGGTRFRAEPAHGLTVGSMGQFVGVGELDELAFLQAREHPRNLRTGRFAPLHDAVLGRVHEWTIDASALWSDTRHQDIRSTPSASAI